MVDRPMPVGASDPRATLEAWLDFARDGVAAKVAGLDELEARRRLVDSATTVLGIVRHLAAAEEWWFHCVVAGGVEDPALAARNDWTLDETTLESALDTYAHQCARSRAIQATVPELATRVAHSRHDTLDYSWVLTHMIEETARHLGHLDVLVEQLVGRTGT
jgi:uncharacterized damage-inducible protein DinB